MFARVFALLPLALLASASHLEARDQCNTGSMNCCNSVQSASELTSVLALFGGVFANVAPTTLLGFNCSPLSGVGVTSNSCTQQPVCCTNNDFNGLVNVGCTPINVGL